MNYLTTGGFLLYEWLKTLIIFALIDKIIIRKKISEILKSHDTYISSLVVAAFLILIREQSLTIGLFIIWSLLLLIIYVLIRTISRVLFKLQ